MDFSTMQTEVFRRLEESSSSPVFWTLAQIKESINKGYREIADATEYYEVNDTVPLTTAVYAYDLTDASYSFSPTILTVKACYNNQTKRWMTSGTVRDWDAEFWQWEHAVGEPVQFTIRGLWWLQFDRAVSSTAGTVTVYYTAIPTDLSANSDTPGFPQEFHLALVDYAIYDLLCQDREPKKALFYFERYKARQEALKRYVDQRTGIDRVGVMGSE